jgi:membrane fusion protein, heavy metal efflux system
MNKLHHWICISLLLLTVGCDQIPAQHAAAPEHDDAAEGAHGGKLLSDDGFALEITIFERGIPPEYRVWPSFEAEPISPNEVDLTIRLDRLGDVRDEIRFSPESGFLRGNSEVYEPHSFVVIVDARFRGRDYSWQYENFEGRTQISPDMIDEAGIEVETVGPAMLRDYVAVYGRIASNPEGLSHVAARFGGVIQSVNASIGDEIKKGRRLATIEANDSLNSYDIFAPISGTVIERHANAGETTSGRTLFTILDTRIVWAELAIFPSNRANVKVGAPVTIRSAIGEFGTTGRVAHLTPIAKDDQSITARVRIDNREGFFTSRMYVTAEIEVAEYEVALAVKRNGLQKFRDFTVVFAKFDDVYEVRMLELGRHDDIWMEVLDGISANTPYVTSNSYLIKADIEKSGASHDH